MSRPELVVTRFAEYVGFRDKLLGSDMYSTYKAFHDGVRQFCWTHIIRGIKGIKHSCRSPDAVRFSKWMLSQTGRMFALRHAFKRGDFDRQTLVRKSSRSEAA